MAEHELPCLDLLAATPGILRGLMCEVSDEDARWKPAPDRFSIAEVLAHLSHSESRCYRMRVDRFLSEERPELQPDDAQFHLDLYRNADPEDEFDHFEEQREAPRRGHFLEEVVQHRHPGGDLARPAREVEASRSRGGHSSERSTEAPRSRNRSSIRS